MAGIRAQLIDTQPITDGIILTRFALSEPLSFNAGQHVMVSLRSEGGQTIERPFSVASSPRRAGEIEFMVQLKEGSPVAYFFSNAHNGSTIGLRDPQGMLTVERNNRPLHFVAAGMGLAPFRSICEDLFGGDYSSHIRLSHLREPASWGPIDEELARWHKTRNNFSYSLIHTSTLQASQEGWGWRHLSLGEPRNGEVTYLCGSPAFVSRLASEMAERGFMSDQIVTGG
jgi:benzoate/toluate 1,2-dioxygenase reductase subunit